MAVLLRYLSAAEAGLDGFVDSMEPLALEAALTQARIDDDAPDAAHVKSFFIPGARQLAETKTGAAIRLAKYRQTLTEFPMSGRDRNGFMPGAPFSRQSASIPIKTAHGLVQSIDSITYIDTYGVSQTLDSGLYSLVKTDEANTEICPAFGKPWPLAAVTANAVTVEYTAGMAPDAFADRFPSVIQWLLLAATWAYENRQLMTTGTREAFNAMPESYVDTLLDPIRIAPRF
jgi:hypothetical protein